LVQRAVGFHGCAAWPATRNLRAGFSGLPQGPIFKRFGAAPNRRGHHSDLSLRTSRFSARTVQTARMFKSIRLGGLSCSSGRGNPLESRSIDGETPAKRAGSFSGRPCSVPERNIGQSLDLCWTGPLPAPGSSCGKVQCSRKVEWAIQTGRLHCGRVHFPVLIATRFPPPKGGHACGGILGGDPERYRLTARLVKQRKSQEITREASDSPAVARWQLLHQARPEFRGPNPRPGLATGGSLRDLVRKFTVRDHLRQLVGGRGGRKSAGRDP